MAMNILAYGANGAQMAAGTQALVDAGHRVRAFTRSEAGAARWRAKGVAAMVGDMGDLETLRQASNGQDALFMHIPLIPNPQNKPDDDGSTYGLNALKAAKEAGIARVIWNTGGSIMDPSSEKETGAVILRALQEGGFSFLGLTPITYMENLLGPWTTAGLTGGKLRYPTPASFRMQWVAAADFGRVADKALQGELPNDVLALGGPAALDGDELAHIIGDVLDRDLSFETMPAPEFERHLSVPAGPTVAGMIAGMYGGIQANPNQFKPGFLTDAASIQTRFGLALTPLSDWVSEHRSDFIS